jgi:CRP/FNR family transcriptional regulator
MAGIEQMIRSFPFVEQLSKDCQRELIRHSTISVDQRDEILLMRGDPVSGAYLVVAGELEVFTLSDEGRETVLYTIGQGESCVFALNSLFNDIAYPVWVKVTTDVSRTIVVDGSFLRRSFHTEKALRDWVLEVQSTRVIDLICSIDEILNLPVAERLKNYLIRSAKINGEIRQTHEVIAKHLGSSREVITRNLKLLADAKRVSLGRGCITLLDIDKLDQESVRKQ